MPSRQGHVMVPGDLWQRTRQAASLTGTTPTQLVRSAIEHALRELDADPSVSVLSRVLLSLQTAVRLLEQELSRPDGGLSPVSPSSGARPPEEP